jgi:hypothetical protein
METVARAGKLLFPEVLFNALVTGSQPMWYRFRCRLQSRDSSFTMFAFDPGSEVFRVPPSQDGSI